MTEGVGREDDGLFFRPDSAAANILLRFRTGAGQGEAEAVCLSGIACEIDCSGIDFTDDQLFSLNGVTLALERFPDRLNREGFANLAGSDSSSLPMEVGRDGESAFR